MKRIITAMLTLALFTGLSAEKASAQSFMTNNAVTIVGSKGTSRIRGGDFRAESVIFVTADSEEGHRGIPIAGVDRLIPVAESFVTSNVDSVIDCRPVVYIVDSVFDCRANVHIVDSDDDPDFIDDPNFILDDMPFLELDSPLLPWHGR
jgi:hypothetical protein